MDHPFFPPELKPFEAVAPVVGQRTAGDVRRALHGLARRYDCAATVSEVLGSVLQEELARQEYNEATAGRVAR